MLRLILLLSLLLSPLFLSNGCATVATSGAEAIYNHHSIRKSANDHYITMRAYQAIGIDSDHFKNTNINIATYNRVVLLSGQVPYSWQKIEAGYIVRKLKGVDKVYNVITIENPSSQLTRLNDAWITAKVKATLWISSDIDATQIKVVTENRRVFLMGMLRPKDAEAAVHVARHVAGVDQVVKVFFYLNLSQIPAADG